VCLGIPGRVVSIDQNALGVAQGQVSFGGIVKEVCLAWVPEAQVGDYVVVHVGFAISRIDEKEALEGFRLLEEMAETAELRIAQPGPDPGRIPS